MCEGIIVKGIGGFYYVKTDEGIYECKARGIFRKKRITPMVGDYVEINEKSASIEGIKERRNHLIRPPVANVDILVVVMAAMTPDPNLFLVDKLLVNAEKNGIYTVICINKTDLCQRDDIERIYTAAGYKVFNVSAERDENLEQIKKIIAGKVTAFAGLSGVGKSTILGRITRYNPQTGDLSEKIGRGRHTTRHVELLELSGGGYVFDTPGFGSFELSDIKASELYRYFPEMVKLEGLCRFKGCAHIKERDCAVKKAVENGDIPPERYESYSVLYDELKKINEYR